MASHKLCDACDAAWKKLLVAAERYTFVELHSSIADLRASANWCLTCKTILDKSGALFSTKLLRDDQTQDIDGRVGLEVLSNVPNHHGTAREIRVEPSITIGSGYSCATRNRVFGVRFVLCSSIPSLDRLSIPGYQPHGNTGSDSCLAMARYWIRKCSVEHKMCMRPRETPEQRDWRPSRLVFIDRGARTLRIVEADDMPAKVSYASVSHRWGQSTRENLCLQKGNIDQWKIRIPPLRGLTAITEAIDAARRLGFSYIWIDSLCIIQDCTEDWRRECALMSNVYKYSELNIAAASAGSNDYGCFWERRIRRELPVRLRVARPAFGRRWDTKYPTNQPSQPDVVDLHINDPESNWLTYVNEAPLNARGWVLQERLLAPRTLSFTSSQLFWECNELRASEACPFGFISPDATLSANVKLLSSLNFHRDADKPNNGEDAQDLSNDAIQEWKSVVREYTRLDVVEGLAAENLTRPSDKLPAVSAIARELKPLIKSDYLAGHWRHNLTEQLGWFRTEGRCKRTKIYRAPSWSWASVDGNVNFSNLSGCSVVDMADITATRIKLAGTDEMGEVQPGSYIQLRGHLFPITVRESPARDQEILYSNQSIGFHPIADDDETPLAGLERLFLLPLQLLLGAERFYGTGHIKCLVLRRVEGQMTYHRVGYADNWRPNREDFDTNPVLKEIGNVVDLEYGWTIEPRKERLAELTII